MRPLDGIVVLDLTRFLPGAVATATLMSFGAEVIKIEQPGSGDPARGIEGASWLFAETNRSKKSVALNLKNARGKQLFRRLARTADVVIESFRPTVMNRLGIGYTDLSGLNKGLIYAALSGYGQNGRHAALAGHDINYMAMSGLLDLISPAGEMPLIPEIQIADIAGGSSHIVIGILLALLARDKTGHGQRVDVSITAGLEGLLSLPLAALHSSRHPLKRGNELLSGAYACYHPYRAKDGRWLVVGALEPKFWANLCRKIQCADLIADQFSPVSRQRRVKQRLSRVFKSRTAEEWFGLLRDHDCCVTPVRTLQEAVRDGQFHTRALGIELERTAAAAERRPAPRVGQHSMEILKRAGVSKSELRLLQKAGVIAG
ncbi:MAG: CaiB/BaiF CoA-transferase family protein [Candidatus Acidiferrum sp.]